MSSAGVGVAEGVAEGGRQLNLRALPQGGFRVIHQVREFASLPFRSWIYIDSSAISVSVTLTNTANT